MKRIRIQVTRIRIQHVTRIRIQHVRKIRIQHVTRCFRIITEGNNIFHFIVYKSFVGFCINKPWILFEDDVEVVYQQLNDLWCLKIITEGHNILHFIMYNSL